MYKRQIIYWSITGFGQNGPLALLPGYDFVIQAMAGIMSITGEKDGPPIKPGVAYADIFTSLYSVIAIQAALHSRKKTGIGSFIDMSLYDTQLAVLANQASTYLLNGIEPKRMGNKHPSIVPYQLFEAKDGDIIIACGNDQQFKSLCNAFEWDFANSKKKVKVARKGLDRFLISKQSNKYLKLIILISAGLVLFFYLIVKNDKSLDRPEFPLVVLISLIGMMFMVSIHIKTLK